MKTSKLTYLLCIALLISSAVHSAPTGVKKTFTQLNGQAIMHPQQIPRDGLGTQRFLNEVCRQLSYQEAVAHKRIVSAHPIHDTAPKEQSRLNTNPPPLIYESVTCFKAPG